MALDENKKLVLMHVMLYTEITNVEHQIKKLLQRKERLEEELKDLEEAIEHSGVEF